MSDNKYKISEIFYSPQGEGRYTGHLTAWVRSFTCNLQCDGFGQKDPTDPSTYILPYKNFDTATIQKIEDLPVFEYGCDSSYSWSAKYKHLCPTLTAKEIARRVLDQLPNKSLWQPKARNMIHVAFTGGEPLLKNGQQMIVEVMQELRASGEDVMKATVETNGTQVLSDSFSNFLASNYYRARPNYEFFFSISPKLFTVSGESRDKAINEEAIKSIARTSMPGQLKFVVSNEDRAWKEMDEVITIFRDNGVSFPVYVMPVSATLEGQEKVMKEVAYRAMENGYNIAARVHCWIFGNQVGT